MQDATSHDSASTEAAEFNRVLSERIVMLHTTIDDNLANRVCAEMFLLAADNSDKDIKLYINSIGGSIVSGMAIYETMQFVECDVATTVLGVAFGMGQLLLSAGTRGKRCALPYARIMMRPPSAGVGGTALDIRIQTEMFRRTKLEMAELIARHAGQTVERILADWDPERYFTAEEALAYGLIDHIISRRPSDRT